MENQVINAIYNRRSTRGFEDTPLTQDQINTLINVATASPTALNLQSWHFTFCSDKAAVSAVEKEVGRLIMSSSDEDAKKRMKTRDMEVFYNAPTVIFISSDQDSDWRHLDAGIAVENLALAAHSMGLGSVIIGMCKMAFDGPNGAEFDNLLKFPEGHKFSIALAVGIPKVNKDAHTVGENKITVM